MEVLPLIALGARFTGRVVQGVGQRAGYMHEADQSEVAAQVGRINANEIDADRTREMGNTIAAIRAIQASAGAPVNSTAAETYIRGEVTEADRERVRAVRSERLQALQHQIDATYYRRAGRGALFGSIFGGAADAIEGYSLFKGT